MTDHVWYKCDGNHEGICIHCDGGIKSCAVCNGSEGVLTTECPGRPMTDEQIDEVYAGRLDFKKGQWRTIPHLRLVKG